MSFPYWLQGSLLGIAYTAIIIFLKGICSSEWCFADIFLPFIFQPLVILDLILPSSQIVFLGNNLLMSVFVFWFVFGAILGWIYGVLKRKIESKKPH